MKLKNLVLMILLGAGASYGGVKGYIYYKVKKQVDNLVASASLFADIEYGSIGSTFSGEVTVEDIEIYPRGYNDSVHIDEVRVITPGLDFLLKGSESLQRGELPERIGIAMQGARIDLTGQLVDNMEQAEAEVLGYLPEEGLACSISNAFMTAQYRELGVNELVIDSDFVFKRSQDASRLFVTTHYTMRGIEEADAEITMQLPGGALMGLAQTGPTFDKASIAFRTDPAFNKHTLDYCSRLQQVDIPTLIEQMVERDDEQYLQDFGFVPGPGIRMALKQFLQNPGEIRIVAQPGSTSDLNRLHLYKPSDWPQLLGLVVTVNGTAVEDLSITIPTIETDEKENSASGFRIPALALFQQEEQHETPAKATNRQNQHKRLRYRPVDHKNLKELVGKNVRVITYDGKRRSGRVLKVVKGTLTLESRVHGGTLTTQVSIGRAKKIEVLELG